MPAKNAVKVYVENSHYHVYNRGVEKREIFTSSQDYMIFLRYLAGYISSPKVVPQNSGEISLPSYQRKNYQSKIELKAFVLMPNHYHLLIRQTDERVIADFIQSLSTRYTAYFNKKHNRVGGLFQGRYKAVMVGGDDQLLHLTRYIHLNPIDLGVDLTNLANYRYSSYANYVKESKFDWVDNDSILKIINDDNEMAKKTYRKFVQEQAGTDIIRNVIID